MNIADLIALIGKPDIEIARRLGCHENAVRRWRIGERIPNPFVRKDLCRLAGLKVADVDWERVEAKP